jgi:hypothetical protein
MDKGIHCSGLFGWQDLSDIKPLHFASDMRVKSARIKARDSSDTGPTVNDIVPSRWNIVADGAHDA